MLNLRVLATGGRPPCCDVGVPVRLRLRKYCVRSTLPSGPCAGESSQAVLRITYGVMKMPGSILDGALGSLHNPRGEAGCQPESGLRAGRLHGGHLASCWLQTSFIYTESSL